MNSSEVWQELSDLRSGTEAYAEQVSRDFEELTWLRHLLEQLDSCDASSPLDRIAQQVLPELRIMIRAEAVVLVGTDPSSAWIEPGSQSECRVLFADGRRLAGDDRFLDLIAALTAQAGEFPLVRNHISSAWLPAGCAGIHSCIVVPVSRQGEHYGWMLALNRVHRAVQSAHGSEGAQESYGDNEFGTEEAGLFQAAARTLASHARNTQLFREKELLLIGVIRALINAIDAKDAYTWGHSDRVALMAKRLGEQLQLDELECERLYTAGLLHDIGKIGIPDSILQKAGPLTNDEFDAIKKHPEIGHSILQHLHQLSYVLPGVLHHHESIDGRGYPHRLQGEGIPLFGRILAVADSYDAMTSCRPYRTAMSPEIALGRLQAGAGKQWDARVVAAFLTCSEDIRKLCGDARGQVLHGAEAGPVDGNAPAGAHHDALESAVAALSH
ncbi:MAG: HD-GYP domain-containing protein [Planctomycetia bacterium]|nr:HD-GYP domain-containing protein [Planctomycetia bacterium]